MSIADEFPLAEDDPQLSKSSETRTPVSQNASGVDVRGFWSQLKFWGLVEPVFRLGTHLLVIILVIFAVWGVQKFILNPPSPDNLQVPQRAALAAPEEQASPEAIPVLQAEPEKISLPELSPRYEILFAGVPRYAMLHTTIPNRPRVEVITYTVQAGDTVFGIASIYGLKPETIFWGNRDVLNDNPHNLRVGQVLNILPVNGTYHKWSAGENLGRVAEFYGVETASILEFPGNKFDLTSINLDNPQIPTGAYLIIPDGKREFIDWGPPRIYRDNPAVARTYGPGHCGSVVDGAVGGGGFIWPTTATFLSGYDYNPAANHSGIDIAGQIGNPIYAVDAGVVVYAGWSNYGYGNLVVLDHGNGWQSLYAHLDTIFVSCGQSVFQGTSLGGLGSTGNSSGPHLHFELLYGSAKVNPWDFVSP